MEKSYGMKKKFEGYKDDKKEKLRNFIRNRFRYLIEMPLEEAIIKTKDLLD